MKQKPKWRPLTPSALLLLSLAPLAASQVAPPRQLTQAAPYAPWPHCATVNCAGSLQLLPSQQPMQVEALQVVPPKQVPLWQVWPAA